MTAAGDAAPAGAWLEGSGAEAEAFERRVAAACEALSATHARLVERKRRSEAEGAELRQRCARAELAARDALRLLAGDVPCQQGDTAVALPAAASAAAPRDGGMSDTEVDTLRSARVARGRQCLSYYRERSLPPTPAADAPTTWPHASLIDTG